MELWIRSQDKTRLMKVCSLNYGEYQGIHYINGYCINEVDNVDLGTYKTKERALEVLDEIQKTMAKTLDCIVKQTDNCVVGCDTLVIYEMPKE